LLKGFLKKVCADGLEVVAEQIAEPEALLAFQVLLPFEQQPAGLLQNGCVSFLRRATRFSGADLVERLVDLRHDMEAIKDVKGLGALLADHLQIGLPHVGADEHDLRSQFVADDGKESLKGFDSPLLPTQSRRVTPRSIW
jgi:hypothetical protein